MSLPKQAIPKRYEPTKMNNAIVIMWATGGIIPLGMLLIIAKLCGT